MESSCFLKGVIIILLLINISTLAFMWFRHPLGPPIPPPRREAFAFLTRELQLTPDQQDQYRQMRDRHHAAMEEINQQNRDLHERLFNLLSAAGNDSSQVRQITDSIAANEKRGDLITFYHFQQVRSICTPQQQKKFDEVINDALQMMGPKPPPPPR